MLPAHLVRRRLLRDEPGRRSMGRWVRSTSQPKSTGGKRAILRVLSLPSIYSRLGVGVASGACRLQTKESVVEFVNELKALSGGKPITEQELNTAKHARIRGYAQQFEAVSRIADQIAGLWVAGLPMTELQREPSELEQATLSAVNAVAQKYSAPGGVTLLLVGDLSKIEAGVRELNLGEIIILDNEGKLVTKNVAAGAVRLVMICQKTER